MASELGRELADQLDWHWQHQLRPRLEGLTDDEYLWEPAQPAWSIRDGMIDFAYPPPEPPPVTTIAWRLGHMTVPCFALRNHSHFGGPPVVFETWPWAETADEALEQLDEQYAAWHAGVLALTGEQLAAPCGPTEGPWGDLPMATLVLHINREIIHHGAEVSLLRDLYRARG